MHWLTESYRYFYATLMRGSLLVTLFFCFNATAPTEIYTLSLHDALPISGFGLELPEPEEAEEVRALFGKRAVALVCRRRLFERPLARVLDREIGRAHV